MRLSVGIMKEELESSFSIVDKNIRWDEQERIFHQVYLVNEETLFKNGNIYIAYGADLPKKPFFDGRSMIISIGPSDRDYLSATCDYIELDNTLTITTVFNHIQKIFAKYEKWHQKVMNMLLNGRGIKEVLKESLPFFDNPVYFHDKNYHFIAYEAVEHLEPSDLYGIKKNDGKLSPEEIDLLRTTPGFEKTFNAIRTTYHIDRGEYNYIYNNIRVNGKFYGRIFVPEIIRKIKDSDYALLDELSYLIESTFFSRYYIYPNNYRPLEQEFIKLLNKEKFDTNIVRDELAELNWGRYDSYFLFQVNMKPIDISINTIVSTCELIESRLHNSFAFQFNEKVICLINIGEATDTRDEKLEKAKSIFDNLDLHVGVSMIFHDVYQLNKSYTQTEIALKYRNGDVSESRYHFFEAHAFTHMLDVLINEMSPKMFCPPGLKRLIDYDKENATAFVETLRVYLENESRPVEAIKNLYIHRSTFMYRIERIKEIVNVDLEDSEVRLHFILAFELFDRYREVHNRYSDGDLDMFMHL